MPPAAATFEPLDWIVVSVYLLVVVVLGVQIGRRQETPDDYFLASRSMPLWAVSISVLATALSAATFIGGPEQAFRRDLTYFTANLGALIGAVIVAVLFLPRFYRAKVTSVYELLGYELGSPARHAASAMFLIGRVFASGARLFMVAIPFAWIAFGSAPTHNEMMIAIAIIAVAATAYTAVGGIRAVIWTDVLQAVVVTAAVAIALAMLMSRIPLSLAEIVEVLASTPPENAPAETPPGLGTGKLRWLDLGLDPTRPYTLWAVLTGFVLLNVAAYGTDQDLTQRMLTCKSPRAGSWSVILANIVSWPVVGLFLLLGLMLFIFYQRPDLMGAAAPGYQLDSARDVFVEFVLREMPAGMRGLVMAGLFAAAMSSLDSALNAMSASTIADFYRPWRIGRVGRTMMGRQRELALSRACVVFWGVVLASFASFCVFWHDATDLPLIDFALMVMAFAYSGLLAVFLTAICTRRGNAASAIAALITGFVIIAMFQPWVWSVLKIDELLASTNLADLRFELAFPWQMMLATCLAFIVCCTGRRAAGSSLHT